MSVTKKNNPKLYRTLCQNCDFDTNHIPKHGMGSVIAYAENEGQKYKCYTEWDYSWGVDWDRYQEWGLVNEVIKECACCGQIIS